MILWRAGFRYLLKHPLQIVFAVIGVALGVSVVVAIDLANSSAERAFSLSADALVGRTTHVIVGNADGLSEEILNLLAQVNGLNVAARTSSFAFRDSNEDIREIGRLLNVRTVLEGSVRTSGDRIRLTAQLINVEDGFHIWSKYYDSELDDIFDIQDEVASQIAAAPANAAATPSKRSMSKPIS